MGEIFLTVRGGRAFGGAPLRALITGGSGFAGKALATHLRESGDEVVVWSRSLDGPDITERAHVFDALGDAEPDVVYHLAAQSHVPTAWDDPVTTLRVNVEGTQNVLDAAAAAGEPRVIVVTSAEVYGSVQPDELPISEDAPLRPANPYAASKAAADAVAVGAHLGRGLDVIRMRSFNHFGPGQNTNFVSAGFAQRVAIAAREKRSTIEVGALDVRRDFCDVRDVVRAYRLAAEAGEAGAVYNVCTGVDRSIREIGEAFIARSGADISFVASPELQRPVDTPVVRGSAARLAAKTGWQPEISFEASIDAIFDEAVAKLNEDVQS